MRITKVDVINLFAPIPRGETPPISLLFAERIASVVFGGYRATLGRVHTDAGIDGIGECMVRLAPRATGGAGGVAPIPDQDPRDVEPIWDTLYATMRQRGHVRGMMVEAISGIDIALWDILGKRPACPSASSWAGSTATVSGVTLLPSGSGTWIPLSRRPCATSRWGSRP